MGYPTTSPLYMLTLATLGHSDLIIKPRNMIQLWIIWSMLLLATASPQGYLPPRGNSIVQGSALPRKFSVSGGQKGYSGQSSKQYLPPGGSGSLASLYRSSPSASQYSGSSQYSAGASQYGSSEAYQSGGSGQYTSSTGGHMSSYGSAGGYTGGGGSGASYGGGASGASYGGAASGAAYSRGGPSAAYGGAASGAGYSQGGGSTAYGGGSQYGSSSGRSYGQYATEDPLAEPANYDFAYEVNAPESGAQFGHQESRRDDYAKGSYKVLLPDGRTQIVEYEADQEGYKPTVTYQEAQGGYNAGGYSGGSGYTQGGGYGGSSGYAQGGNSGGYSGGSGRYGGNSGGSAGGKYGGKGGYGNKAIGYSGNTVNTNQGGYKY